MKVLWHFNPKKSFPVPRPCIVFSETGKRMIIRVALLSRPTEFDFCSYQVNKSDGTVFETKEEAFAAYEVFHKKQLERLERSIQSEKEEFERVKKLIEEYGNGKSETATSCSPERT